MSWEVSNMVPWKGRGSLCHNRCVRVALGFNRSWCVHLIPWLTKAGEKVVAEEGSGITSCFPVLAMHACLCSVQDQIYSWASAHTVSAHQCIECKIEFCSRKFCIYTVQLFMQGPDLKGGIAPPTCYLICVFAFYFILLVGDILLLS